MTERAIFAVAGRPVLHSLSPVLFRAAYRSSPRAGIYTRLSAPTGEAALRFAREAGLAGMNITAPLKEGVFGLVEPSDEAAAALDAVNTVVRDGDRWRGFDTDPAGVRGAFARAGIDVRGRRCLVLGAGGAGRAAALALRTGGAQVVLCNRTEARAASAARTLGVSSAPWSERQDVLSRSDVLVSGLPPDVEAVRPDWLRRGLVVLEAAYPAPPLSRRARERGCVVLPGEDWLFGQAAPAFRLFAGSDPDLAAMSEALSAGSCRRAGRRLKVALVGFMGSGKTAVGRILAGALGLAFEDADAWIERRAGLTVPEIFRRHGEASFRDLETVALREIMDGAAGLVCACGGGCVERDENRAVLAANALTVWLHAAPDVCRSRIDAGTRPLLATRLRSEADFAGLFRARLSCYAEAADLAVDSGLPAEETARAIHEEIRRTLAD